MMSRRSLLSHDLVMLARRTNVPKNADTEKVLDDMVEKLGLNAELVTIQPTRSRNKDIHSYAYLTRDKIGGNIHYPDFGIPLDDVNADTSDDDFTTSVSFTWTRTDKFTQKHVIVNNINKLLKQTLSSGLRHGRLHRMVVLHISFGLVSAPERERWILLSRGAKAYHP